MSANGSSSAIASGASPARPPGGEAAAPVETLALPSSSKDESTDKKDLKAGKKGKGGAAIDVVLRKIFMDSGALRTGMIAFLLTYNVRFGAALLMRIATLARTAPKKLLDLGEILSESELQFREEAVRMGLFMGLLSGVYVACKRFLADVVSKTSTSPWPSVDHESDSSRPPAPWWHSFVAGTLAGGSLMIMKRDWHRTLALYMATRACQCFYNFSKSRGYFHFGGSSWAHGDSLLFGLSSSQIMYSYVMRPAALPPSYYAFIRRQGPLDEVVLQSVRDNCRGKPVDTDKLFDYVSKKGGPETLKAVQKYFPDGTKLPRVIPLRAMHPGTASALRFAAFAWWNVARQIFGVYFSLALVPAVVLKFQHFLRQPGQVVFGSLTSAIQSTIFLATFCGGYQAVINVQRYGLDLFNLRDNKLWYWFAGAIASFAILIERKSRRSELALYAFPRAADALYTVLYDRKLIFSIPEGELVLFCLSLGLITFFHENDRSTASPLVTSILERFLPDDVLYHNARRTAAAEGLESDPAALRKKSKSVVLVSATKNHPTYSKSVSSFEFGELRSEVTGGSTGGAAGPQDLEGEESLPESSTPNLSRSATPTNGGPSTTPLKSPQGLISLSGSTLV